MKRMFDFLLALMLLIIFSLPMLLIAILIRVFLGSPALFRQTRPGLHGRPFLICKFRTMVDARDDEGQLLSDAERITQLGRWMRRFSIDELPQLFNVLRGELSLVGPRPLLMEYVPLYTSEQARRHEVLPGITGWAQVNGRNAISWEERFRMDVWYVDHRSFWLDMKILWMSLLKVACSEGITQEGHVTMEKFRGSAS